MPLVFGLLVVFNAVFLAWQFFQQQNSAQAPMTVEAQQGKPLQLLSERGDLSAQKTAAVDEPTEPSRAVTSANESVACYRIGPISDGTMLKQVKSVFERSGFDVRVSTESNRSARYWLYIPPLGSTDKAQAVASELQKKGVDATVVTDTSLANAIALGSVSSPEEADSVKARLMELGYRAESKVTSSSHDEQWLLLTNVGSVAKAQVDRILVGSPQIRRETVSCR